jgi:hypothetical protein
MSDEQMRATIAAMNAAPRIKQALLAQCERGDSGARFVVYAAWRRQKYASKSAL